VQICENDGIDKETDHTMFEVPLKRRKSDCTGDLRPIKRTDVGECENQTDTENQIVASLFHRVNA